VRAFATVRADHPEITLSILGDGDEREQLGQLTESLGVADRVEFRGFIPNPYPFVSSADLFVSSSRYEGFANVIVEAMACGTPVVATDCPSANREMIEEDVSGWFARPEDPDSLAEAIRRGLAERHKLDPQTIRERCEERFGVTRIVSQYEAVLSADTSS
jgi:glycosyltransferase involved in cell wall biosynthesis